MHPHRPFNVPLHTFPIELLSNKNPSSSSDTTGRTEPPRFAQQITITHWIDLSNTIITDFVTTRALATHVRANLALLNENVNQREDVIRHKSEGDVVRTAALYVLHPVNQVFAAHPDTAGNVTCLAEAPSSGLRADVTYYRNPITPAKEKRAFAVVEFKRRQLIEWTEFEAAEKVPAGNSEPTVQRRNELSRRAMGRNHDNTYYEKYSCKLMKQAAAYAISQRTKYVALFNWDALVLVRFQAMPLTDTNNRLRSVEEVKADGVGEWCQTTTITQTQFMRPALLGFLNEAYTQVVFEPSRT